VHEHFDFLRKLSDAGIGFKDLNTRESSLRKSS